MREHQVLPDRRHLLKSGGFLLAGGIAASSFNYLNAQPLEVLDVASAGSVRAILDGPLKIAAAQSLTLDLRSHAQGADAVARALTEGSLHADVFIPITAGPMRTVIQAGKADRAFPIARTEMALVYSPKSRFATRFEAAAAGKADWWEILREPSLRFARGNPAGDPGGRNAFFVMMLAAKKYDHPEVVERLLGPLVNPPSPAGGASNQEMLQSGELDAAMSYRISVGSLPHLVLPREVNLSGDTVAADHPDVSLSIQGKLYRPEPLVFYAATLKDAANPKGAARFVDWLKGTEAQALLRSHQFDAPGETPVLHA